jgi:hypothetical protein
MALTSAGKLLNWLLNTFSRLNGSLWFQLVSPDDVDRSYYTRGFVAEMRWIGVTPHAAQNTSRPGGSAIDSCTTRHEGYAKSINARRGIEKVVGWIKQWGGLRQFLPRPQAEHAGGTSCAASTR